MIRLFFSCLLLTAFALVSGGQAQNSGKEKGGGGKPPPPPGPAVVRLAKQGDRPGASALAHSLIVDPLDQVRGNAAVLWMRAGMEARAVRFKWTEKEWKWDGASETPLDKLPKKEVRAVLEKYATALHFADEAARRTSCDWEQPPLTIQNLATTLPLDSIQMCREVARLLSLRCRLALAEGRFDDARTSVRTGLVLARHLGNSDLVLQDLVGIAVAAVMLGRVEEWMQIPGSPDLYWALGELPHPFISVSRSFRTELGTVYRSFPGLRDLKEKKLSAEQARALVHDLMDSLAKAAGGEMPGWAKGIGTAAAVLRYYPAAKKGLIARGRTAREVEAMPSAQVVALYYLEEYGRVRDEVLKWLTLPGWQSYEGFSKLAERETKRAREDGNSLVALLLPALEKTFQAQLRLEWQISTLRAAEGLRHHVRLKDRPPEKWSELAVPAPVDPTTGKGYGGFYKATKEGAVLEVPAPYKLYPSLGRRFEITSGKR